METSNTIPQKDITNTPLTTSVMGVSMDGVSATLLIPVWAKARESLHAKAILSDPYALRIAKTIDQDLSKFDHAWKSQIGVAARTRILDILVSRFLHEHPTGTVVVLGCGLDSRSQRLDNGVANWIDLDLPEVIELRRCFFKEDDRHKTIGISVLDESWLQNINPQQPLLFMAEGLFMYLPFEESVRIVTAMAKQFPGAEFLLELISPMMAQMQITDSVKKSEAPFKWGLQSGKEMESWNNHISFIDEYPLIQQHLLRWRWMALFAWIPFFRKTNKISRFRFIP